MDNMLRTALRKHRELRNQFENCLLGDDGDTWEAEAKKFLARRPCWTPNGGSEAGTTAKPKRTLLQPIGTIVVSATSEKFETSKRFVAGNKPVKISIVWDDFQRWFGDKVEDPIGETTLGYVELKRNSRDKPIIAELGGEEKAETTLAEIFSLMSNQPNGEDGVLLTNGYANIFYVKDVSGVLRAVDVGWRDGGWFVSAFSVVRPDVWFGGFRIFSRNSASPVSA